MNQVIAKDYAEKLKMMCMQFNARLDAELNALMDEIVAFNRQNAIDAALDAGDRATFEQLTKMLVE